MSNYFLKLKITDGNFVTINISHIAFIEPMTDDEDCPQSIIHLMSVIDNILEVQASYRNIMNTLNKEHFILDLEE